ncbi:MAG: hypothetical protein CME06_07055 [Gemmatimonadetes bacterium]|nr:hypothetical protein [Gemmatimonadota bacterium]
MVRLFLLCVLLASCQGSPGTGVEGKRLGELVGTTHKGDRFAARDHSAAGALVFIAHGNQCPIMRQYYPVIAKLEKRYSERGIPFFLVDASPQDSPESITKELAGYKAESFTVLVDESQEIVKRLGLRITSEAAIVDPRTWKIVYRGAIDDLITYDVQKTHARKSYLVDALEAHLKGKPIARPRSRAMGCFITIKS